MMIARWLERVLLCCCLELLIAAPRVAFLHQMSERQKTSRDRADRKGQFAFGRSKAEPQPQPQATATPVRCK